MSDAKRVFKPETSRIVQDALSVLHKKLPGHLTYHTASHTEDVLNEALCFAQADNLDQRSQELLAIAAVFHDMGFLVREEDNEGLGAEYAAEAMRKQGGYSEAEIKAVEAMILDTAVQKTAKGFCQVPTTELSKYLCDADLSNLGRNDFFERGELRRPELGSPPKKEFLLYVKGFIESHEWHTPAAKRLRQKQKDKNYAELLERLKAF